MSTLLARLRRHFHCLRHTFNGHRAVTVRRGWRVLLIGCDCGRVFYRRDTWPVSWEDA